MYADITPTLEGIERLFPEDPRLLFIQYDLKISLIQTKMLKINFERLNTLWARFAKEK